MFPFLVQGFAPSPFGKEKVGMRMTKAQTSSPTTPPSVGEPSPFQKERG